MRNTTGFKAASLSVMASASAALALYAGCVSDDSTSPTLSLDAGGPDVATSQDAATADRGAPDVETADVVVSDAGNDAADTSDASDAMPIVALDSGTYTAGATWGPLAAASPPNYMGGIWGSQTLTFDSAGQLLQIANASWSLSTTPPLPEYGADGIVAWGRWSSGTCTISGVNPSMAPVSYIAGARPSSTSAFKATYDVFASTAPTALGGSTMLGTANVVTGTVAYDSGSGNVTVNLSNIVVGGQSFAVTGTVGPFDTTGFLGAGTVTSSSGACDAGCTGNITNAPLLQGWFVGATGERVALNYGFTSTIGTVSGAVVLK